MAHTPDDWEADCLGCDPFDGDYGGSGDGDGILSDKIVTARTGGECHTCAGSITPGTRVRRRAEVYDGEFMRFSWCEDCCKAMPDFDAYEARVDLGVRRRAALSKVQP